MGKVDLDLVQPSAPNNFGNQASGNPSRSPLHFEDTSEAVEIVWGRNGMTGLDSRYPSTTSFESSLLFQQEASSLTGVAAGTSSRAWTFICKDGLFH